jgi:act minimal PKS acyl carrier protein
MTNDRSITLTDLVTVLRECAGEAEGVDLDGDVADRTFDELGYDSIALLETCARMADRHGLHIDDDVVGELRTPDELVRYLNQAPAKAEV